MQEAVISLRLLYMFIREDRKSVIFQEKSCFSRSKTIEMKDGLSMDLNRH